MLPLCRQSNTKHHETNCFLPGVNIAEVSPSGLHLLESHPGSGSGSGLSDQWL